MAHERVRHPGRAVGLRDETQQESVSCLRLQYQGNTVREGRFSTLLFRLVALDFGPDFRNLKIERPYNETGTLLVLVEL